KLVLGTPAWPGSLGEYFVIPQGSVFKVPEHLSVDQATMIEPMAVAVHAAKRAQLQAEESVLILGGGSIGHVTAAMSQVRGASPIIVADIKQHCLDNIRKMGATHTILVGQQPIAETVMEITDGKGVNVVFLTVGVGEQFADAFASVRKQGRIVVIALYKAPTMIHPYDIVKRDIDVRGSIMSNDEDVHEALELIASGKVDVEPMVTHHLPIEQAQRAFELVASKDDGAVKVVLDFD
ncbi:MAG: zinc-binding dehydrogenase, partial [Chloroflexi bacterium]|nr:zinc-binding dehydrogenase [Chloroflexota bacterium]